MGVYNMYCIRIFVGGPCEWGTMALCCTEQQECHCQESKWCEVTFHASQHDKESCEITRGCMLEVYREVLCGRTNSSERGCMRAHHMPAISPVHNTCKTGTCAVKGTPIMCTLLPLHYPCTTMSLYLSLPASEQH